MIRARQARLNGAISRRSPTSIACAGVMRSSAARVRRMPSWPSRRRRADLHRPETPRLPRPDVDVGGAVRAIRRSASLGAIACVGTTRSTSPHHPAGRTYNRSGRFFWRVVGDPIDVLSPWGEVGEGVQHEIGSGIPSPPIPSGGERARHEWVSSAA